jgi:hypothetical protein
MTVTVNLMAADVVFITFVANITVITIIMNIITIITNNTVAIILVVAVIFMQCKWPRATPQNCSCATRQ